MAASARRATEEPGGVLNQHVEDSEGVQRRNRRQLRCRSRKPVRNVG